MLWSPIAGINITVLPIPVKNAFMLEAGAEAPAYLSSYSSSIRREEGDDEEPRRDVEDDKEKKTIAAEFSTEQ